MLFIALLARSVPVSAADDAKNDGAAPHLKIIVPVEKVEKRPRVLPALYVGLAGFQAYDAYSTIRGVGQGVGRETNPLVGGLASQPVAFWSLKAISTATSIYYAEQLWRQHHRGKAIAMMVAANGMMAFVSARNASVLSSAR